ncbi:hypothetical protein F4821DRAFT_3879 [Hypoxylon rubiginosum]|uniref:Uncharacterized protein n=1 Tax=Hypoxylon rubiginosum TaxID=110542 RepID=A0ACC0DMG0_9PEZI|nr:hypothetical protein F4821DRAFT_3879 [Hypoxylon rubiginosum]
MSPTLASQCHRAAHRHLRPQHDSVWISETLLAATFERFCVTSTTTTRHGSSVPGPMENRRRMGRRRMGELSFGQSHSAAPLWGLENLADLTQWQWKPPSSPDARIEQLKTKGARRRSLLNVVLDLLSGLFAPRSNPTSNPLPKLVCDAHADPSEVVGVGLNSLRQDLPSSITTQAWTNFKSFCDSWKDCLADGHFSGERICFVLDGIQRGLCMTRLGDEELLSLVTVSKLELCLLQATIAGLSSRSVSQDNHFDCLAWNSVIQKISGLQVNNLTIFKAAMAHIPDCHLSDVATGIVANLRTYLTASRHGKKVSTLARQASKMAQPLTRLDPANHLHILQSGTQFVLLDKNSKGLIYHRARLAWLYLLARLPCVSESYLAEVCSTLEAGKAKPLSRRAICRLYLLKHQSSIKHVTALYSTLIQNRWNTSDSESYNSFCMVAWQTKQFHVVLGLCEFIHMLGRQQDIMWIARALRDLVKNEATPLMNLALGARQPELAIKILSLYQQHSDSPTRYWKKDFLTSALKVLMKSRSVRQDKILSALDLVRPLRRRGRRAETITKRQLLDTATASIVFANSPGVSNRTSLRLISQCIGYLRARHRNAVLPKAALRALLYNITRDLAEGKPGRTARLRWVLGLFQKHAGYQQMLHIGLVLRRWRDLNHRRCRESIG